MSITINRLFVGLFKRVLPVAVFFTATGNSFAQSPLFIPPQLSGTNFSLDIQNGITQFYPGINTPTYGVNGPLLAPTLILNKWDWVTMNVTNNLTGFGNSTTIHWHGLHVPAAADGGPHQIINQGTTWSPQFQVLNDAGTFWYHPHGDGKTDLHVSKGIAGLIIIKDSVEAALNLPRMYGVDDFPIIVQTKCFDVLNQIAIATAFDTVPMVNGIINPYLEAPAQVIRFRLLNGASERTFQLGFSNNMNFHLIATDGGLIDSSVTLNRLRLANGERAEILLDLSSHLNDTIYLMSYGSELTHGIMGADSVGDAINQVPDYYSNFLNGSDFNLLQLRIVPPTSSPVTSIPAVLTQNHPWDTNSVTFHRVLELDTLSDGFTTPNLAEGPFGINRKFFEMDSINETVFLNAVEIWTVRNKTMTAHPIHIHDTQFYILDEAGRPVPGFERGKKDVVLVMPKDSIRFITKFEDFTNDTVPYMFHCHVLHHEDDGMMGSFIVIDSTGIGVNEIDSKAFESYPNPSTGEIKIILNQNFLRTASEIFISDLAGRTLLKKPLIASDESIILDLSKFESGVYFIQVNTLDKSFTKKLVVSN